MKGTMAKQMKTRWPTVILIVGVLALLVVVVVPLTSSSSGQGSASASTEASTDGSTDPSSDAGTDGSTDPSTDVPGAALTVAWSDETGFDNGGRPEATATITNASDSATAGAVTFEVDSAPGFNVTTIGAIWGSVQIDPGTMVAITNGALDARSTIVVPVTFGLVDIPSVDDYSVTAHASADGVDSGEDTVTFDPPAE